MHQLVGKETFDNYQDARYGRKRNFDNYRDARYGRKKKTQDSYFFFEVLHFIKRSTKCEL